MASALIIGPTEQHNLNLLRQWAIDHPMSVLDIMRDTKTPQGHQKHIRRMERHTIDIPVLYCVTFSIETNHPAGTCRHMSMSSKSPGRVPTPDAVLMVADELGFVGGLDACKLWAEDIGEGDIAINLAQPVNMKESHKDA